MLGLSARAVDGPFDPIGGTASPCERRSPDDRLQVVEHLTHVSPRRQQIGQHGSDLGLLAEQLIAGRAVLDAVLGPNRAEYILTTGTQL
jgi:hypothetical protein